MKTSKFESNERSESRMSGNLDQNELAKFESIAHEWWDTSGKCRPLHDLNPTRLQYIVDNSGLIGKKVIDIGCGGGILTESMAKRGASVTGIDATGALIQVAKDHAEKNHLNILYETTTAEDYAKEHPGQFDIVTCMELLEHVPNPKSIIEASANLVKPGGDLFFSTLNRNVKSYLMAILGAEYVLQLLPKNTHEYEKLIKPSELDAWLRENDLNLQEIKGLEYNPFTKRVSLTQDVSVNYLAFVKKPIDPLYI